MTLAFSGEFFTTYDLGLQGVFIKGLDYCFGAGMFITEGGKTFE